MRRPALLLCLASLAVASSSGAAAQSPADSLAGTEAVVAPPADSLALDAPRSVALSDSGAVRAPADTVYARPLVARPLVELASRAADDPLGALQVAAPDSLVVTPGASVDPLRLGLAAGAIVAGNAAIFAWEKSRWWEGSLDEFHFDDHLDYAANVDKAAHFYATEVQALGVARVLEGAGLERAHAALGGAAVGWLMQLQVEYHDAFYPQWGFDRYDLAANTLGAAWFYSQERVPALRRFDTRWGYVPRDPNPALWFNEDYQHHTYWVTARVHDVLPEPVRDVWPRALRLSTGLAVADWDPARPYDTGHAEWYLSLDLDYHELLPARTLLGRTLADALARIHLPAPALRLAPRPKLYLLFWGQ